MTATQTSAVMRQWDTQWILKTTLWDNSEILQMSCSRHQINSWTEEPFLLLKKSLTKVSDKPKPTWPYVKIPRLCTSILYFAGLSLSNAQINWRSKNVWKICKNKQTRQGTNTFWHCCRDACLSKGLRQCQLHSGRHMRSSQSMFRVEQLCFFAGLQ